MNWTVTLSKKTKKNIPKMPQKARKTLALLIREIELAGPVRGNWPNYSKLGEENHH
jgi:mRNA-degrading endonuclease RelE of RelBE toxin-antitoxin system